MGEEIGTEEEEIGTEEAPIFLSKKHGKCNKPLKMVAQNWDAGVVCGTTADELTLSCDADRQGARILVLSIKPKPAGHNNAGAGNDPLIEDTTGSIEEEPFLARRGGHHGHKHNGKKKGGKQLGAALTDVCANQAGECTTTLGADLSAMLAETPEVDDTTRLLVKYMCSYEPL